RQVPDLFCGQYRKMKIIGEMRDRQDTCPPRRSSFLRGRAKSGISNAGYSEHLALLQNAQSAARFAFPQALEFSSRAGRKTALENLFRGCLAIPRCARS